MSSSLIIYSRTDGKQKLFTINKKNSQNSESIKSNYLEEASDFNLQSC